MHAEIQNALQNLGINAFGMAMPRISPRWLAGDMLPTVNETSLSLTSSDANWLCPLPAVVRTVAAGERLAVTLTRPEGASVSGEGLLATLVPQAYLRLTRLYARVLEGTDENPVRPVPRYFFYAGSTGEPAGGLPGDDLDMGGVMTVYDEHGLPMDPLAVAAALQVLMDVHPLLQQRSNPGEAFDPGHQVGSIADLATAAEVRVRLCLPSGRPYGGAHLEGITAQSTAAGIFTLDAADGSGSDLSGRVSRAAPDDAFPIEAAEQLLVGPATTGQLDVAFAPPVLPAGVTLTRDFFTLQVVDLRPYLLGEPDPAFNGSQLEPRAAIRLNEPLALLSSGNDLLGAATEALAGATGETLCVAPAVRGDFSTPDAAGDAAVWPNFPPLPPGAAVAGAGPLPVNLRSAFNPAAVFFDDGDAATANVDVILTLEGLPAGSAVRVYNRLFDADANRTRGNGAGGIATDSGVLSLRLPDPLGLRRPGMDEAAITIPSSPTLYCDVVVVKRTGEARVYGAVETPISTTPVTTDPTPTAGNPFTSAVHRGISNAGILGLSNRVLNPLPDIFDLRERLIAIVNQLADNQIPRDAPRLPTMARRDLLVAGQTGSTWRGVLGAGALTPDLHSSDQRLGAPGSPGGREAQSAGIATANGRLAYDMARMALRRTDGFMTRITQLATDGWNEPPALDADDANAGAFAGALLQTVAPLCETPEFSLLKPLVEARINNIPRSLDAVVDLLISLVNDLRNSVAGLPGLTAIVDAVLDPIVAQIEGLKDNDTLSESTAERLYTETLRELSASIYGRRDAQWALQSAIADARRFIYIETNGLAPTRRDYGAESVPPYAVDLFQVLANRLAEAPGLHVILCVPKYPDFAAGYEPFAAREVIERRTAVLDLPPERVVAFHPIGFPGRASQVEHTTVIVDDLWALVGSSTLRRRGLTFDGGSDLVFTDRNRVRGVSPAIGALRRSLLATRLGVSAHGVDNAGQPLPEPSFVRLGDGVDAFHLTREMLVAGGQGKIARLWNGRTPGVPAIDPATVPSEVANPEGVEFNLQATLALDLRA